jgi:hypothetical protein
MVRSIVAFKNCAKDEDSDSDSSLTLRLGSPTRND